jgi:hypothetical protein
MFTNTESKTIVQNNSSAFQMHSVLGVHAVAWAENAVWAHLCLCLSVCHVFCGGWSACLGGGHCSYGGTDSTWIGMAFMKEWPKMQQWPQITSVQQWPWCCMKNTFGISVYLKEYTSLVILHTPLVFMFIYS